MKFFKKLVAVLAIFILITEASKKVLQRVFCIQYPIQFWKKQEEIKVLIILDSEVNAMMHNYTLKLGF